LAAGDGPIPVFTARSLHGTVHTIAASPFYSLLAFDSLLDSLLESLLDSLLDSLLGSLLERAVLGEE
jgi:hypothetical protein